MIQLTNIEGFDFDFSFNDYVGTYLGTATFNGNTIDSKISISEDAIDAMKYEVISYKGSQLIKTHNAITGSAMYYHDISSLDGKVTAEASYTPESDRFGLQVHDYSLNDVSYDDILNYYTSTISSRICIPCVFAIAAAATAITCGVINAIEADHCTDAFEAACGDGGSSCCSMEFEGGHCGGGDCNIDC